MQGGAMGCVDYDGDGVPDNQDHDAVSWSLGCVCTSA